MKKTFLTFSMFTILVVALSEQVIAQDNGLKDYYIGLIPSVLVEPYDTINAIEVNFFPLLYEFRIGDQNDIGFQVRPILNYRFFDDQSGFSQTGGSVVVNKYFLNMVDENFWLKPQLGIYYTYAYNRLDRIQTMTLGIEPGAFMQISNQFSLSLNLQPGLNYYPDEDSQDFVSSESGFKGHFGLIFHIGYNF